VFGELLPEPGVAEKPPPKRREKGLSVDPEPEPKPGSRLADESPLVALTFEAGCEPP
jgi:hypothetical protein